mmetsp:Transcript_96241/g.215413  ORF Transcript_96241/g.215413 Transcript_96241/m.215413 type:complete len:314 (-) Transcript_96241:53-994(-)
MAASELNSPKKVTLSEFCEVARAEGSPVGVAAETQRLGAAAAAAPPREAARDVPSRPRPEPLESPRSSPAATLAAPLARQRSGSSQEPKSPLRSGRSSLSQRVLRCRECEALRARQKELLNRVEHGRELDGEAQERAVAAEDLRQAHQDAFREASEELGGLRLELAEATRLLGAQQFRVEEAVTQGLTQEAELVKQRKKLTLAMMEGPGAVLASVTSTDSQVMVLQAALKAAARERDQEVEGVLALARAARRLLAEGNPALEAACEAVEVKLGHVGATRRRSSSRHSSPSPFSRQLSSSSIGTAANGGPPRWR